MRFCAAVTMAILLVTSVFAADAPEAAAGAQSMFGGYTSLRLDEAGVFVGGFDGTIDHLSDGVRITLLSKDPELKPLPISAREMKFTWSEKGGEGTPSRILLEGKVAIDHPQATVRAENADWNLEKGMLVFTGAPIITTAQVPQGIEGQKVVLDFNTNKFEVYGGRAKEIVLGQGMAQAAGDANLLKESDIADWPKFLEAIRAQAAADKASPGKQIVALLDAKVQKLLTTTPVDTLLGDKPAILKQINRVLSNPKLYTEAAWADVTIDEPTKALLDQGAQAPMTRLNRSLVSAAFPGIVAAAPEPKN